MIAFDPQRQEQYCLVDPTGVPVVAQNSLFKPAASLLGAGGARLQLRRVQGGAALRSPRTQRRDGRQEARLLAGSGYASGVVIWGGQGLLRTAL